MSSRPLVGALVAVLVGCAGCTVVRAPGVSDTGAHLVRELPTGDTLYDDGRVYLADTGVFVDSVPRRGTHNER